MIKVFYQDKRGAHCMRALDTSDAAARFMAALRCEATAKDDTGRIVGEVYRLDKANRLDRRRKWGWWVEGDLACPARRETGAV